LVRDTAATLLPTKQVCSAS